MKNNIVEEITSRILDDLGKGVCPWEKPWKKESHPVPVNASTSRPYRGVNTLVLWVEGIRNGFSTQAWVTYRQAAALGGRVRQGEHGTRIVFYSKLTKPRKAGKGEEVPREERTFWLLRYYTVFNLDQTEGLQEYRPQVGKVEPFRAVEAAEKIMADCGVRIVYGGDKAFYDRQGDLITLPPKENFKTPVSFYATALHEEIHASGHPSRLDRDLGGRFGDQAYAFEELVAEMGAAFLCAHVGIPYDTQHSNYIGDWIRVLRDHQRALFTAAAQAQRAMDFILKRKFEEAAA